MTRCVLRDWSCFLNKQSTDLIKLKFQKSRETSHTVSVLCLSKIDDPGKKIFSIYCFVKILEYLFLPLNENTFEFSNVCFKIYSKKQNERILNIY